MEGKVICQNKWSNISIFTMNSEAEIIGTLSQRITWMDSASSPTLSVGRQETEKELYAQMKHKKLLSYILHGRIGSLVDTSLFWY